MAKKKSNQILILTILLSVFVVLSTIQAVQITSISNKIEAQGFTLGSSNDATYSSGSSKPSSSIPANIQELPQMVGGC